MHDHREALKGHDVRMVEPLIEALALCVPQLDPTPLRVRPPARTELPNMLSWMTEHLKRQGLLSHVEWKAYLGQVPDLKSLSAIDFSEFDSDYVTELLFSINWEAVPPELLNTIPYELPYLEYLNAFLCGHGLRVVDLAPFEHAYMLAVIDDPKLLEQLNHCLWPFGMGVNLREPLDQKGVAAYLEGLLRGGG
ncbi:MULTISPECIES: hypothetical protein [Pseudomonas]|uniref:hypothetical protein n=1 Tax=Pseudomonas TaxID=286 RepID=UPI0023611F51|nr:MULTISPECIES: hypothetical protein [Pseudomonas]WJV25575.1 hypothetical protein PSR66_05920 [Pseudomonas chlororaphis]